MRPSSSACVSLSIQWRSSTIRRTACSRASRRSNRVTASSVRWRRSVGSSVRHAASSTGTSSSVSNAGSVGFSWVERAPRSIVDGYIEQCQQRRERRLQSLVQREQLARHLLTDLAEVVPVLDLEVTLEEIDDRQVARRLAVRHRRALQNQPALHAMGVGEFVDEARLAHPGLADDRHQLTVTAAGELLRAVEVVLLGVAADEP